MKWSELPSRKRDMLVHANVLKQDFTSQCSGVPDEDGYCPYCQQGGLTNALHFLQLSIPRYSWDWRDVQEVIEHFAQVSMFFMRSNRYTGGQLYSAEIHDQRQIHRGMASTLPEAICIAALKAVEVNIEE